VPASEIQQDLQRLDLELRRLESEYNMFFAGRLPRPPWQTRSRVEAVVKRYDRAFIPNYGDRFRFSTIQSRFAALVELWDRELRARDEGGRPGVLSRPRRETADPKTPDRILHVTSLHDPAAEEEKLRDLYESLAAAHREAGGEPVPFPRFETLVRNQISKLRATGAPEVAFRVALKKGKVSFTARAMKGVVSE
jgi:hypothetical protein